MRVVGKAVDTLAAYRILADYTVKINILGFVVSFSFLTLVRESTLPRTKVTKRDFNQC